MADIGPSTTNQDLAAAIDQILEAGDFNPHDYSVLDEAAQRIRETPDED